MAPVTMSGAVALSIAEAGGTRDLPAYVRLIENFEAAGKLDRVVEGLETSEEYKRRAGEGKGLMRPELAVFRAANSALNVIARRSLTAAAQKLVYWQKDHQLLATIAVCTYATSKCRPRLTIATA